MTPDYYRVIQNAKLAAALAETMKLFAETMQWDKVLATAADLRKAVTEMEDQFR